jgi:hypothetical protein
MTLTVDTEEVPVRVVGSSVFGRYPTISVERTYNMFVSTSGDGEEEWLVNFAGYESIIAFFASSTEGRGLFHSVRGDFLIAVVGAAVFRSNDVTETPVQIGTLGTTTGEVFIDENLSSQIAIVDGQNVYIYNYAASAFALATLTGGGGAGDLQPNYVTYQNTYFIFGNALTTNAGSQWFVFEKGTGDTELDYVQTLTLQTKPDFAKAALRIPGKGNNLLVFGSTVAEIWTNIGGLQVYQRNASINIDFGCASVSTIAANEEVVAWLGINEKSSPALMAMRGGNAERISTDGLDFLLDTVQFVEQSTAFFYRQDGHLFYVLSFFNSADNFSITFDFTSNKIYDITDWDFSYFPARQVAYFNNQTYFVSLKDGHLYEMGSDITTYDLSSDNSTLYEIPRIRVTNTFRFPRPEKFKIKLFTFVIESGTTAQAYDTPTCFGYILDEVNNAIIYSEDGLPLLVEGGYCYTNKPRVDLTISKNGGITFSNTVPYLLKATGQFQNQPRFNQLGYAEQITYQMRFWGMGRFVVKNGVMEIGG